MTSCSFATTVLTPLFVALLLGFGTSCRQQVAAPAPTIVPTPYTTANGLLSVDFPAPFEVETKRSDTPSGEIVIELATCKFNDSVLSTASTLYPFKPDQFDAAKRLDRAVEGVVRSSNGSLFRSAPVELHGMLGQEGVIHLRDNIYYRYRIVVNGKAPSLYMVQVVGAKDWVESEEMDAFIESMDVAKNDAKPLAP